MVHDGLHAEGLEVCGLVEAVVTQNRSLKILMNGIGIQRLLRHLFHLEQVLKVILAILQLHVGVLEVVDQLVFFVVAVFLGVGILAG